MRAVLHDIDRGPSGERLWSEACQDFGNLLILNLEELTQEIRRIEQVLQKVARRAKRKQPGTFELLNDPSLLGYES